MWSLCQSLQKLGLMLQQVRQSQNQCLPCWLPALQSPQKLEPK